VICVVVVDGSVGGGTMTVVVVVGGSVVVVVVVEVACAFAGIGEEGPQGVLWNMKPRLEQGSPAQQQTTRIFAAPLVARMDNPLTADLVAVRAGGLTGAKMTPVGEGDSVAKGHLAPPPERHNSGFSQDDTRGGPLQLSVAMGSVRCGVHVWGFRSI
jgi:hypothetical protein